MNKLSVATITSLLLGLAVCCVPAFAHGPALRPGAHYTIIKTGPQVDWAQYSFDAAHDGYNPNETILTIDNVGRIQEAWSFSTGSATSHAADNPAGNVIEANG